MSWNPNQGQDPNQPSQYGGYSPPPQQPTDPYSQPNPQNPYQQGSYQQAPQSPYGAGQQQYSNYQPPLGAAAASTQYGESSMGMAQNTAAGLSYIAGWVTGIIFFLLEKKNRFVRFHAMQSILFFGGASVLGFVLRFASDFAPGFLSLGFACLAGIVGLVAFVGWIVLMINGFQGKYFKLPVVGDMAERYANQGIPGMPGV
jgi:uncharacterized membrane protein